MTGQESRSRKRAGQARVAGPANPLGPHDPYAIVRPNGADRGIKRGSGPKAAMGAEWCQVRRLIEQPESLPVVAGHPEVFRVVE
jgi:hypothetical protein